MKTGWPMLSVLALLMVAVAGPAVAADCQGRIGPETSVTARESYDPFSPADLVDAHRIGIANTGAAACSYGLVFRARSPRPVLGGTLSYTIVGASGTELLTSLAGTLAPAARLAGPLAPSANASLEIQLVIPRGQHAAPGLYRDGVDLELYALDASGRPSGQPLDTAPLALAAGVARIMSVNIRGAGLGTTVDFGVLGQGQQRTVTIEARSNDSYQLDVTSDHGGQLVLTQPLPSRQWAVPYAATLSGQRLDLSGRASLPALPATRPESDAGHPLTVTIGDVANKHAGRYQDVITVEITAAMP